MAICRYGAGGLPSAAARSSKIDVARRIEARDAQAVEFEIELARVFDALACACRDHRLVADLELLADAVDLQRAFALAQDVAFGDAVETVQLRGHAGLDAGERQRRFGRLVAIVQFGDVAALLGPELRLIVLWYEKLRQHSNLPGYLDKCETTLTSVRKRFDICQRLSLRGPAGDGPASMPVAVSTRSRHRRNDGFRAGAGSLPRRTSCNDREK